jgi:YHS domain-containing protein
MNAPIRYAVKACLMTAVCGLLCNQAACLFAQDNDTSSAGNPDSAKIKQVQAESQAMAGQAAPANSQPESDVQKQLRKMYNKNGREMPSMNMDDLPNTQPQAPAPAGAQSGVGGMPTGPVLQQAKPNWFERTFHIGRGRRQPAPATQYAAPTPPPTAPYRYPATTPALRPGMTPYRAAFPPAPLAAGPAKPAPVVAGPAAQASPAQPQFREPAPLGPTTAPRNLAARPPTVRPARPRKDSQPLLDESGVSEDSESLDLEDDEPKVAGSAPKVLSSQAANGPAESPYSGIRISPNQTEQQITSRPLAAPAGETTIKAPVSGQLSESGASAQPTVDELAPPGAKSSPPAVAAAKPGNVDLQLKDDDADDDDDDDLLTLPSSDPGKHTAAAVDKTEKSADKPREPAPFGGLKGICPVVLKDSRRLLDAQPTIKSEFRGRIYTFSSIEAKSAFDENPRKYAPAGDGNDVVRLLSGEAGVEGTLEHAAWYRGRLYLFSTADSRHEFIDTPSKFVVED